MTRNPFRILILAAPVLLLAFAAGCSRQDPIGPAADPYANKDGTETLGPPSIDIAPGARFVEGGVGMVGVDAAELTIDVPQDAAIRQVLLYWAGGTTAPAGDDEITLGGTPVQGELIGGPTLFFDNYSFSAYRADITGLELVSPGTNTLTVAGFDFAIDPWDENDGVSIVVVYDDGGQAALELRDGLDMAYFGFAPTLNSTVPQVFAVEPAAEARTADLLIIAASVGENRPNTIRVTTAAGVQEFSNPLGSFDGLQWDSVVLPVDLAPGVGQVEVELMSTNTETALGASLGWVVAGLSVPAPAAGPGQDVSGTVFADTDLDGVRDDFEYGIPGVVVSLTDGQGATTTAVTDDAGAYAFSVGTGSYTVAVDISTGPDAFNSDLAQSFDPTTPVSFGVDVPPGATAVDFGFTPRTQQIVQDLSDGTLQSNALPGLYWRKIMRRALILEQSNRQGSGHEVNHDELDNGWGHDENFYSPDELRAILASVQDLYYFQPYRFTPGEEIAEAYDLLATRSRDAETQLLREMFITELNYVVGRGIIGQTDRTGVLIAWGESIFQFTEEEPAKALSADKGRNTTLVEAYVIFQAINTGGGGAVDE